MRAIEILPESWWDGLDDGALAMMGHDTKDQVPDTTSPKDEVAREVEAIRSRPR